MTATNGRPRSPTPPRSAVRRPARLLASPYWRERVLGWAGHDEFTAEQQRTIAPGYAWGYRPRARWRHGSDDPLLEWRLPTRRLTFEPLPPGHAWNLPETSNRQPQAQSPAGTQKLCVTQIGGTIRSGKRPGAHAHDAAGA